MAELKMLDEKDFLNLQLRVTQGLREQLTIQAISPLYIIRPNQLSVSTQLTTALELLDEQETKLTDAMEKILTQEDFVKY
jgi:F0F1-type ATP synthase delta subunit